MDSTTRVITVLIIMIALSLLAISFIVARQRVRRNRPLFALRPIPAYAAMPSLVGKAIESNRPLHLGLGSAGLGGNSTLLALASAELFYQVAREGSIGDVPPIVSVSDGSAVPLAQDSLRHGYQPSGRAHLVRYANVRWYPAGKRSLAYAAAVTALMGDDSISSNILAGSFGPELALIMEASNRRKLPIIAASDQLEGQAVAYALSEYAFIGEELFASGAYLEGNPGQSAAIATTDILRWLMVALIIFMALDAQFHIFEPILRAILQIFGVRGG